MAEKELKKLKKELEKLRKKAEKGEINLDVIIKFEEKVEAAKIPEGERRWFKSEIGRLKEVLDNIGKVYEAEARKTIDALPVDYKLKEALEYFFFTHARKIKKWSPNTMRTYKLPYVADLIKWMYEKKGRKKVTIEDFDKKVFTPAKYGQFLTERFESETTRYNARSHINAFLKTLDVNYPISTPDVFLPKPERKRIETGEEEVEGIPRKFNELQRIFMALGTPTPRWPRWKAEMYPLYAKFLLQGCLRYGQWLETIRVSDLYTGIVEVEDDVFGYTRKFIRLPTRLILEREKKRIGERITRKFPPTFAYISKSLYDDLIRFADKMGYAESDYLFKESERNMQARHDAIRSMTGIHDFTFYDFRATSASALFNILGKGDRAAEEVRKRGGWKPDSKIPFESYVRLMDLSNAIRIVEEYEIYISPEVAEDAKDVIKGKPVEVSPEEFEKVKRLLTPELVEVLTSKEFQEFLSEFVRKRR